MSEWNEATVDVNGHRLSVGEVMTIRVALCSLVSDMQQPNAIGDDDHGKAMAIGYVKCAMAILSRLKP
jgi:hypothetical protein